MKKVTKQIIDRIEGDRTAWCDDEKIGWVLGEYQTKKWCLMNEDNKADKKPLILETIDKIRKILERSNE